MLNNFVKDKLICLQDFVGCNFTSKKKQGPIKLLKQKNGYAEYSGA